MILSNHRAVGIITLPLSYNIGGILQAFALCKSCNDHGYNSFLITRRKNRQNLFLQSASYLKWKCIQLISLTLNLNRFPFLLSFPLFAVQQFKNKHLQGANKVFFSEKAISKWAECYPCHSFICGSDQIWNSTSYPSLAFAFARFDLSGVYKRIAYAASLGHPTDRFPKYQESEIKSYLSDFDAISVREHSAVTILSRYTSKTVEVMPDPTFLLNRQVYIKLTEDASHMYPEKHLFIYLLDPTSEQCRSIARLARILGLVPVSFYPKDYKSLMHRSPEYLKAFGISTVSSPSLENWLRGIANADLIITDSYHGTVFSLIFNRPFYTLVNQSRGLARFETLKALFPIGNSFIYPSCDFLLPDDLPDSIDWNHVNERIYSLRSKGLSFLAANL
jgi:hypothetical protein